MRGKGDFIGLVEREFFLRDDTRCRLNGGN